MTSNPRRPTIEQTMAEVYDRRHPHEARASPSAPRRIVVAADDPPPLPAWIVPPPTGRPALAQFHDPVGLEDGHNPAVPPQPEFFYDPPKPPETWGGWPMWLVEQWFGAFARAVEHPRAEDPTLDRFHRGVRG